MSEDRAPGNTATMHNWTVESPRCQPRRQNRLGVIWTPKRPVRHQEWENLSIKKSILSSSLVLFSFTHRLTLTVPASFNLEILIRAILQLPSQLASQTSEHLHPLQLSPSSGHRRPLALVSTALSQHYACSAVRHGRCRSFVSSDG